MRLLQGLGIAHRPRLIALHDHNERERAADIVALAATEDVLVLTDAGMPTVSDPGYVLLRAAIADNIPVTVLPGPSAVLVALALSGLPTDRFAFEGFPPRRAGERAARFAEIAADSRTLVFFEAPGRVSDTLAALAEVFGATRPAAVCRELTKLHEEVRRGDLGELAAWAAGGLRGEVCIVVGGATAARPPFAEAVAQVQDLVAEGTGLRAASAVVAEATGHGRRSLYQAALAARATPAGGDDPGEMGRVAGGA